MSKRHRHKQKNENKVETPTNNLIFITIYLLSLLVLGYLIGTSIWESLKLPFTNTYDIRSLHTSMNFNPSNNILRYIVFVSLPTIFLGLSLAFPFLRGKLLLDEVNTPDIKNEDDESNGEFPHVSKLNGLFITLFLAIPLVGILQMDWPRYLDIFHDGEQLTAAFNYTAKGELWLGSNFIHGVFYDVLSTVWAWDILGYQTIGAFRVSTVFLTYFSIVSLALLIYVISTFFRNRVISFASTLILFSSYLLTNKYQYLNRRDSFTFLGVSILLLAIKQNRYSSILFFISGSFSALTYFYTIDRGAYYSVLLIAVSLLLYLIESNKKDAIKRIISIISGISFGWIVFYLAFSHQEWSRFIENTLIFYRFKDYYDGYIYPFPDIFTAFNSTLPLVATSFNILVFSYLFLVRYIKHEDKTILLLHFSILLLSILYFRSGLGRSDLDHISYASTLIYICFGLTLGIFLSLATIRPYYIYFASIISMIFLILYMLFTRLPYINIEKIKSFSYRTSEYMKLSNDSHYGREVAVGVARLKEIFKDEDCYFAFTTEPGIGFLIGKPTCGDAYSPWLSSPNILRERLINDLEAYKPEFIIYARTDKSDAINLLDSPYRLPDVNDYILKSYEPYETVQNFWVVYRLKNNR